MNWFDMPLTEATIGDLLLLLLFVGFIFWIFK